MQREYSTNYHQHRITLNPSAGDIVIAKSPVDNMWYRGRVMQEEENEEFTIFYVDFGNLELVCFLISNYIVHAQILSVLSNLLYFFLGSYA